MTIMNSAECAEEKHSACLYQLEGSLETIVVFVVKLKKKCTQLTRPEWP